MMTHRTEEPIAQTILPTHTISKLVLRYFPKLMVQLKFYHLTNSSLSINMHMPILPLDIVVYEKFTYIDGGLASAQYSHTG